jgi:hypothetical protein
VRRALDVLRSILVVPDEAPAAGAKLQELCAQMQAGRSATDAAGAVAALRQVGMSSNGRGFFVDHRRRSASSTRNFRVSGMSPSALSARRRFGANSDEDQLLPSREDWTTRFPSRV